MAVQTTPKPASSSDIIADLRAAEPESAIKTMKLYSQVDRVMKFLDADPDAQCKDVISHKDVMSKYDNMSYMTEEIFHDISDLLELKREAGEPRKRLLDFGCGIAGPMRSVARVSDCEAVGIELQADLTHHANLLSKRCGMDATCSVVAGNLLEMDLERFGKFDALKSILVILHIPKELRVPLFQKMTQVLKPGAPIVIEDYVMLQEFSPEIMLKLAKDVYAQELPTKEFYQQQLTEAGLVDVVFHDRTAIWKEFVTSRRNIFVDGKERFVEIQGEECYEKLVHFYNAVVSCFESGQLGGFRITARTVAQGA